MKTTTKKTNKAPKSSETFRVYRLPKSDRLAAARARTKQGVTQAAWLQAAVDDQLPIIRQELFAVLGETPKDARGPARLPMSDQSLDALKVASKVTGIPASRLLELCLRRHASTSPSSASKRKTPRKAR